METVKVIRTMGGEHSRVSATVELKIEEDKVRIEGGEVRYMGTRRALTTQTGKGSNNSRDGQEARHSSLDVTQHGNSKQKQFTNGDGRKHKANTGQRLGGTLGQHMAQGSGTRGAGGPMRRRQAAGISNARNKAVEIITLVDTDDEEERNELEATLIKMLERRNWRKRSL